MQVADIVKNINLVSKQMDEHLSLIYDGSTLNIYQRKVDIALMSGYGGRLDATNIIPSAELSIITNMQGSHGASGAIDDSPMKAGIIVKNGALILKKTPGDII